MERAKARAEDPGKVGSETGERGEKVPWVSWGLLFVVLLGIGGWTASTLILSGVAGLGESLESDLAARGDAYVTLDQAPPDLISGLVAVEDRRFYGHGGTDWIRVAGALWANVKARQVVEGGSTITEQLVDNTVLRDEEEGLPRKLRAVLLAQRVERAYTKDQILEFYLNAVYYGPGSYGIDAASDNYFGEAPSELDPIQQTFLAGVVQGPALYDPSSRCPAARERLDAVINARLNAQTLSATEAEELKATPLAHAGGVCQA